MRGVVVSDAGAKTITVRVSRQFRHPRYEKMVRRDRKIRVHDERDEAGVGDQVEIVECRPMSRTKRWRLVRIVERSPEAVSPLPDDVPEEVMRPVSAAPEPAAPGGGESAGETGEAETGETAQAGAEQEGATPQDQPGGEA